MIKAILIDDEPLARMVVKEYLQHYPEIQVVQECSDGFEGIKAIQQHQPDLVFLDVQMPKINGFEMLELTDPMPAVIFITAFDEYAMKAFESNAVDYLLKPFTAERFDKALKKWLSIYGNKTEKNNPVESVLQQANAHPEERHRIVVKNGNNIRILPVEEVLYIEAYDDYVKIFTKDGYHLKKKTLSYFEQILDSSEFLRVHRSYLIQLKQITRIEPFEKGSYIAILKNGIKIPVSRTGYPKLKVVLGI